MLPYQDKEEAHAEAVRQAAEKMGQDLRSARLARRWSQTELARYAGVSRATFKRMEAGDPTVALGRWLRAWQQMGLLPLLTDATSPHRDEKGERLRRFHEPRRVRRSRARDAEWDD